MKQFVKKLASTLPARHQQTLKRAMYRQQISRGDFVAPEIEFAELANWLKPGDWALDVGANIGHYTSRISNLVGPQGRVLAFEPVTDTFEILATNVSRFSCRNVTLFNAASTDVCQILHFEIPQADTGLNDYFRAQVIQDNDRDSTADRLPVLGIAIDSIHVPERIVLAKIDVEGHEISALRGMKRLLERDHPTLIVEGECEEVLALLTSLGYQFTHHNGSPNRVFTAPSSTRPKPTRSDEDGFGEQRADGDIRQIDSVTNS